MQCSIETKRLPSGGLEVLLEQTDFNHVSRKTHRELFVMPDNETTSLLETHLRRMGMNR